jgi:hypothetical protein
MSLFAPFHRGVQRSASWAEGRPATGTGVTLTASGTPHALGTKVDLFASTAHDASLVRIHVQGSTVNNTQTDQLMNVYVGAASAEQVLIPNLITGWSNVMTTNQVIGRTYEFPLFIPAGTRVSADIQALIASDTVEVLMELFGGGEPLGWCGKGVECLGAVTASSQGTSVTPGTTSEGTFTDIGTTAREWRWIVPMPQGSLTDTVMAGNWVAVDVGVGGAIYQGLEEFHFATSTNEGIQNVHGGRWCRIPSGTALQLRAQNSGSTAEPLDCCIYGVY